MRANEELRMVVFDVAGTTVFDDDNVAEDQLDDGDDTALRP